MRRKLLLLLFLLASFPMWAQVIKNSGIIINAGKSELFSNPPHSIEGVLPPVDMSNSYLKGKFALEFGYRFRLQPEKSRFFYDIDLLGGYTRSDYAINFRSLNNTQFGGSTGINDLLSFSVSGSVNFNIYKGLNVGLGVQPTAYIWDTRFFDVPVFAKVSYDLKYVELAFLYKCGLAKEYKVSPFKSSRLSQWQFSMYVPLWKR